MGRKAHSLRSKGGLAAQCTEMDAKLAKMEKKLGVGGAPKTKKEMKREKQQAKKEKAEIRQLAAKSLEVGNWTEQLLNGGEKFSSTVWFSRRD